MYSEFAVLKFAMLMNNLIKLVFVQKKTKRDPRVVFFCNCIKKCNKFSDQSGILNSSLHHFKYEHNSGDYFLVRL